jgi:hypothetical protein
MARTKPLTLPESRHRDIVVETDDGPVKRVEILPPAGHGNVWVGSTR